MSPCEAGFGSIFPLRQAGDGGEGNVALADDDFLSALDSIEKFAEVILQLADVHSGGHVFNLAKNLAKSISKGLVAYHSGLVEDRGCVEEK